MADSIKYVNHMEVFTTSPGLWRVFPVRDNKGQ